MDQNKTIQEEIIDSALFCFKHFGYKGTTIDMIARKAKIGKGTVYNYFEDKEALLSQITDNIIDRIEELTKDMFESEVIDEEWLNKYFLIIAPKEKDEDFFIKLYTEAASTGSEKVYAVLDRMQQKLFDKHKTMIVRYFETKNITGHDTELATFLLMQLYYALMYTWKQKHEPLPPDRILYILKKLFTVFFNS